MQSALKKKRQDYANQIRSMTKRQYFQNQRKNLLQAQLNGKEDIQYYIYYNLVSILGTQEQVDNLFKLLDQLQQDQQNYEQYCEIEQQASMNFEKLQRLQQIQRKKKQMLQLFQQLEDDEENQGQNKKIQLEKDIQI